MTLTQYTAVRIGTVIVLAIVVGESVALRNFVIPVIALAATSLVLVFLQRRVKGVIADERDFEIGGKASRWAIQVFSWIAVAAMIVLWTQQDRNPSYVVIASTLAYSVCFLLIVYSVLFKYHGSIAHLRVKWPYVMLGMLLFLALFVAGARLFSGEDDWICVDGQWVMHGHPSFPAPTVECRT